MKIGMALASRGRAARALALIERARKLATGAIPVYIRVDQDDEQLSQYTALREYATVEVGPRLAKGSAPHINAAAMAAWRDGCNVVMQVADDQLFETENWDAHLRIAIMRDTPADGIALFYTADGYLDAKQVSHPIVTAHWISHFGYFYPPAYNHFYADTDLENIARRSGRLFYVPEVNIRHYKHGLQDDLYMEIRAQGVMADSRTYLERGAIRDKLVAELGGK